MGGPIVWVFTFWDNRISKEMRSWSMDCKPRLVAWMVWSWPITTPQKSSASNTFHWRTWSVVSMVNPSVFTFAIKKNIKKPPVVAALPEVAWRQQMWPSILAPKCWRRSWISLLRWLMDGYGGELGYQNHPKSQEIVLLCFFLWCFGRYWWFFIYCSVDPIGLRMGFNEKEMGEMIL